jgi:hypothetical protein
MIVNVSQASQVRPTTLDWTDGIEVESEKVVSNKSLARPEGDGFMLSFSFSSWRQMPP